MRKNYSLLQIGLLLGCFIGTPLRAWGQLAESPVYQASYSHDRDENAFAQSFRRAFLLNQKVLLTADHRHEARYNTTLRRQENRIYLDWQLGYSWRDSLRVLFKLNGSYLTDKRLSGQQAPAYRATTSRRNAAAVLIYQPLRRLTVEGEVGYDADYYDRPDDTVQAADNGLGLRLRALSDLTWRETVEAQLDVQMQRSFREIRRQERDNLSGRVTVAAGHGWRPDMNWNFSHGREIYDYPGVIGLERRETIEAQHQLTISGKISDDFIYEARGRFVLSRVNYDSLRQAPNPDRNDVRRRQYEAAADLRYRWAGHEALDLSFSRSWSLRDYDRSSLNDATIDQTTLAIKSRWFLTRQDTLEIRGSLDLVQHSYPEINARIDRDVLSRALSGQWAHYIRQTLRLTLQSGISETHLISLSRFLSANNHRSTTYTLQPEIAYLPINHWRITQRFEAIANYMIYDFVGLNTDDRLVRWFGAISTVEIPLRSWLLPRLTYRYEPQDQGGFRYNPERGKRLYQPARSQLLNIASVEVKYLLFGALELTPSYIFQETKLRTRVAQKWKPVSRRHQESFGIRANYLTQRLQLTGFATHIQRRGLSDYWQVECSLGAFF